MPPLDCSSRSLGIVSSRGGTSVARVRHWAPALILVAGALACAEDDQTPAGPEAGTPLAVTAAATALGSTLSFYQVSAGYHHSCGVTLDNRAFCWGFRGSGNPSPSALGDGSTDGSTTPVPVAGGLRFHQLSAGYATTCGVTLDHLAYCWGANARGEIGDGTNAFRAKPVRVVGGHLFRQIETNLEHTCAVSYPDNRLFCWGRNVDGELGDGTQTDRPKPVAVASTLAFRQVSAGYDHTCAVTMDDRALCWGTNKYGQVGDITKALHRLKPFRVGSGLAFHQVDAGHNFTCATTTDNKAYCWGDGRNGQLGDNGSAIVFSPQPVAGNLRFTFVTAGGFQACGQTTGRKAYCWGILYYLSDNLTSRQRSPVAIGGGLTFVQLSAGENQSCGKTPESEAYCWGSGQSGELGNGAGTNSARPVPVGRITPVVDGSIRDGSLVVSNLPLDVLHVPTLESRAIIEFRIPGSAGGVTRATLTLHVNEANGPFPFTVAALSYAGDGALSVQDWDRGTALASFSYGGETSIKLDVTTALKSLAASGATFMGFNLRFAVPSQVPLNGPFVSFTSIEVGPPAELEVIR